MIADVMAPDRIAARSALVHLTVLPPGGPLTLRLPPQEYLSQEDLQRGFKEGQLFRGKLRVNPGDRREVRRGGAGGGVAVGT